MEAVYYPHSKEPPQHYHPFQEEDFKILEGQMTVRMEQRIMILAEGDTLHIPKNTSHSMWNNSDTRAVVSWKVGPALDTEYFLETLTGLAIDKKTNQKGRPPLLQAALTARRYSKVFRLSKPPHLLQKIIFTVLSPVGLLVGYRAYYKEYFE
jgi:uncharacterized cupin superfamily protein